jgi:hypothetical protein
VDWAIEPRIARIARVWLWGATVALPAAAILLPFVGFQWSRPIFLLPMLNCVVIWAVVLFGARRTISTGMKLSLEILAGRSNEMSTEVRDLRAAAWSLFPLLLWPWVLIPFTWVFAILARSAA